MYDQGYVNGSLVVGSLLVIHAHNLHVEICVLICTERRHSQITHLARVISVRDLLQQVSARSPPSTPIPSRSLLSLQFWPKNVHSQSKVHYTGRFKVKYMVQARQSRKDHEDAHYAAAIFRHQRECAVKFSVIVFLCVQCHRSLE